MKSVGFLGLGRMGMPMALNLVHAGFDVIAYNRTMSKAHEFTSKSGARIAQTPREAAVGVDVVITMLTDEAALRATCSGKNGFLSVLRPGTIVIDMGTSGPEAVAALSESVTAVGGVLLDAPVSGSTAMAESGSLTIMVGGPSDSVSSVTPLLEVLGQRIFHLGAVGAGAAMKLAVNLVIFGLGQAISEALVLAESAGIERELAYEVFENSAVGAPMVKYRHEAFVRPGSAPTAFSLNLAAKDLNLVTRLASTLGTSVPQSRTNLVQVEAAIAAGLGEQDMAAIAVHLRDQRSTASKEQTG
jgi:3-hydroxyisobutyrate dehydrogenase-like beta-hydroxyacid dehydrogenase